MLAKFGNVTTFCRKFSGKKFPVQKSYDMSQNFATRNFRIANFLSRFCKLCLKLSTKIPVTHFLTEMCTRNPSRNFVQDLQILHGNVRNSGIPIPGGVPPPVSGFLGGVPPRNRDSGVSHISVQNLQILDKVSARIPRTHFCQEMCNRNFCRQL